MSTQCDRETLFFETALGNPKKRKAGEKKKKRAERNRKPFVRRLVENAVRGWKSVALKARSRRHGAEACRLWRTTKRRTSGIRREKRKRGRTTGTTGKKCATDSQAVGRSTAHVRNSQCASFEGCGAQEICKGRQCEHRSHECRLTCRMGCAKGSRC